MGLFYFLYALKPGPLTLMAVAAAGSLAITSIGLLSLIVLVAVVAVVVRYNLLVIEKLAAGQREAPALTEALDGNGAVLLLKVVGMTLIAIFAGYKLVQSTGSLGVLAIYVAVLSFLTPASMIALAITHSLKAAINPLKLLEFTLVIGWPYWLLLIITNVISFAPTILMAVVSDKLPSWAIMPTTAATVTYFYIVSSAVMGYICLTRQQKLGVAALYEDDDNYLEENEFLCKRAQAEAQIFLREGDFTSARQALVEGLRRFPSDEILNERYYRLLLATKDKKALLELGPHLLEKFVQINRPHKAAELYIATEPTPAVRKSEVRHAIAQVLYHQHKYQLAAQLLNNLHKEAYPQLDAAYLLLAQVYIDGLGREDLAKKLLHFLRQKFPDSAFRSQINTLWNVLNSTADIH
ncbi:tetratricopeptide repeat protein [Microbulbifer sp. ANSA003]|uniref:tetratricopeptide repeat protein n=1 Tax=Microbulbifer sp. ANSA003 TaxID=3243360 RepID=UPI004042BD2C